MCYDFVPGGSQPLFTLSSLASLGCAFWVLFGAWLCNAPTCLRNVGLRGKRLRRASNAAHLRFTSAIAHLAALLALNEATLSTAHCTPQHSKSYGTCSPTQARTLRFCFCQGAKEGQGLTNQPYHRDNPDSNVSNTETALVVFDVFLTNVGAAACTIARMLVGAVARTRVSR